jgi:hypothetical protein
MRYRLRTLLIVLALGPVLLAWGYAAVRHELDRRAAQQRLDDAADISFNAYLIELREQKSRGLAP